MIVQPGVNNLLICGRCIKKEKLTASKFYIAVVKKVNPTQKNKYSWVKTSATSHGTANESVALKAYVYLLTTQAVPVNLVQPELILSKCSLSFRYYVILS